MALTIIEMLSKEAGAERRNLFIAASLSGLANAFVIALINSVARSIPNVRMHSFVLFALSVALYVLTSRYTFHRTTQLVESALHHIKIRIVDKIRRMDLQGFERVGTSEIYDRITENVTVISTSAGMIAATLQSLCVLVFSALYLAWISVPALMLISLLLGSGLMLFRSNQDLVENGLRQLGSFRLAFFDQLTDLLKGFKETRFNARRSQELREDVLRTSERLRDSTIKTNSLFDDNLIFSNTLLFALLASVVFVLPQHLEMKSTQVTQIIAALMLSWNSVAIAVNCYPAYIRSNHALMALESLEQKLESGSDPLAKEALVSNPWKGRFSRIEISQLEYTYSPTTDDGMSFHIGPVDLTLHSGEVVFIVGGNGSGKSTFLKAFTGLYPASAGSIRVDGVRVDSHTLAAYRELICTIFTDFHLFSRLYGLLDVQPEAVQALIAQMQLEEQTSFSQQRFTRRELSTGQRKRLAMIVALLEDRPLYIFDEWAADQDPTFRHYFYKELLPMLRARGKTVVAVSHDDRYFSCADRVVTMEYGQVRSIEQHGEGAPPPPSPEKTS